MKINKDISDLFRMRNEEFDKRPSPHAWNRLERKLDAHRNKTPHHLFAQLLMVAAVIFLVVLTSLITIYIGHHTAPSAIQSADRPLHLEELNHPQPPFMETYAVLDFQKKHIARLTTSLPEGDRGRQLIPLQMKSRQEKQK